MARAESSRRGLAIDPAPSAFHVGRMQETSQAETETQLWPAEYSSQHYSQRFTLNDPSMCSPVPQAPIHLARSLIDDLEIGEKLPRRELFDFLLV